MASASSLSSITAPIDGVLAVKLPAARRTGLGERLVLIALVAGIDVDGDERELDRRALAQDIEDLNQRPAVLAAGQADHHAVAVFDQVEVDDRLGGLLGESRFERRAIGHWVYVTVTSSTEDKGQTREQRVSRSTSSKSGSMSILL